jgi:hypothetical protein
MRLEEAPARGAAPSETQPALVRADERDADEAGEAAPRQHVGGGSAERAAPVVAKRNDVARDARPAAPAVACADKLDALLEAHATRDELLLDERELERRRERREAAKVVAVADAELGQPPAPNVSVAVAAQRREHGDGDGDGGGDVGVASEELGVQVVGLALGVLVDGAELAAEALQVRRERLRAGVSAAAAHGGRPHLGREPQHAERAERPPHKRRAELGDAARRARRNAQRGAHGGIVGRQAARMRRAVDRGERLPEQADAAAVRKGVERRVGIVLGQRLGPRRQERPGAALPGPALVAGERARAAHCSVDVATAMARGISGAARGRLGWRLGGPHRRLALPLRGQVHALRILILLDVGHTPRATLPRLGLPIDPRRRPFLAGGVAEAPRQHALAPRVPSLLCQRRPSRR